MKWFNENCAKRYGKFACIESVSVVPSGCGEGTCRWEAVVVKGEDKGWESKTVRMESASPFPFFKSNV